MDNTQSKILDLKEKIHDLQEYLGSDVCRGCAEIGLKLENYIEQLKILIDHMNPNS